MSTPSGYFGPKRSLTERAIAAAKLDARAFEEVEADTTATSQAAAVVAVVALAEGIGHAGGGVFHILFGICGALLGWILWSVITYFVGVTLFKGTATVGELLRTLGFAQAPGVLYVLGIVPGFGGLISFAIAIWILIAGIIAIRQALDISTAKAVVTAIVGWLVIVVPLAMLAGAGFFTFR